jgi:hypothetical protein
LIVALAIMVALGLVVIGGTALFGTLTSKSGAPVASGSPSSTAGTPAGNFATVTVTGATAKMLATVPTTKQILISDTLKKGDVRILNAPDVDLIIYDPGAVAVSLRGQLVPIDTSQAQVAFNIKDGRIHKIG